MAINYLTFPFSENVLISFSLLLKHMKYHFNAYNSPACWIPLLSLPLKCRNWGLERWAQSSGFPDHNWEGRCINPPLTPNSRIVSTILIMLISFVLTMFVSIPDSVKFILDDSQLDQESLSMSVGRIGLDPLAWLQISQIIFLTKVSSAIRCAHWWGSPSTDVSVCTTVGSLTQRYLMGSLNNTDTWVPPQCIYPHGYTSAHHEVFTSTDLC